MALSKEQMAELLRESLRMPDAKRRVLAARRTMQEGPILPREYKKVGNLWYLFINGKITRPLSPGEVQWHVARNHFPFVLGGMHPDDPRWWDDLTVAKEKAQTPA